MHKLPLIMQLKSLYWMQAEFPVSWHTAFQDIISLLADGAGTADMFCRILTSVDEDIISLEIPRSAHSTLPPSPPSFRECLTRGFAHFTIILCSSMSAPTPTTGLYIVNGRVGSGFGGIIGWFLKESMSAILE